ncbi:GTP cyclohydrolase 1 [Spirochaetia bacterium]|nr:GTP cyclohydrolase 1 [Spirochaetia bacterium]
MDKQKIEDAVRLFLDGIGEDSGREGLQDTPRRISAMCDEIFSGMGQNADGHLSKTFTAGHNEIILEKDIGFYSVCEHHLLPFFGKVHIAYVPGEKVVGISKLARTVEVYARRLQIQERMTVQIAEAIMGNLKPQGVAVMAQAEHTCMTMRGIKKPGVQTMSLAVRGVFETNPVLLDRFLQMIK